LRGRDSLDDHSLDLIFREARTQHSWHPDALAAELLRRVYDLAKMGPTSGNSSPARFTFIVSKSARERLRPALGPRNVDQTMAAPATVIVGYDTRFYEHLPVLFPHNPGMPATFASNAALTEETAFRNSSLQGAYLLIAARALGLDCGPMSGFDAAKVNAEFWPDGRIKANFLCNLGYGDGKAVFPRGPRLTFGQACEVV
jgi:3-hydroxypropanoate dehydrogenase